RFAAPLRKARGGGKLIRARWRELSWLARDGRGPLLEERPRSAVLARPVQRQGKRVNRVGGLGARSAEPAAKREHLPPQRDRLTDILFEVVHLGQALETRGHVGVRLAVQPPSGGQRLLDQRTRAVVLAELRFH